MIDVLRKVHLSSDIVTEEELNETISSIVHGLSDDVNPKLSIIADLVEEEVERVDSISANLSGYSKIGHQHSASEISSGLAPVATTGSYNDLTDKPDGVSLSDYTPLSTTNILSGEIIDGLSNVIVPKLSTIANLVSAETQKLDELSATVESIAGTDLSSLSTFVKKDDILSVAYLSSLAAYATNDYLSNNYALLSDIPSTSGYTFLSTTSALISTITNELSNNINPKLSTIAGQVSAETDRLDTLSGNLSNYTLVSDYNALSNSLSNYTEISAHNALESRVISTENQIGNILSILQEINDTEGE